MRKLLIILTTAFFSWIFYLFIPTVNVWNPGIWAFLIFYIIVLVALLTIGDDDYKITIKNKKLWLIPSGISILFFLFWMSGWSLFRAEDYRKLLPKPKESVFTKDISPISLDQLRIVDDSIAHKLGDKVLGSDPALGSIVEANNYTFQSINGNLYYIAPLEHSGLFKALVNDFTHGYIRVSATNMNDVKLIQKTPDGKDIHIVYQPKGAFGKDLKRHLWLHGYAYTLKTDYQFEIDDDGKPWWVVTTYENRIGFSGSDATGVLLINPENGEINEYSISDTPEWLDRIQPTNFIIAQINDWGSFVHGWWNPSDKDKLMTSKGSSIVYGGNGRCYLHTGLTSVGADESTVGFVLVDTKTKETFLYDVVGATEKAAQHSAESMVQEKGYHATFPVPYNIEGVETYFMSLVGKDGLPKMHAMVFIKNYTDVGIGKDVRSTLRSYKNVLFSSGNNIKINDGAAEKILNSLVKRINSDVVQGQTNYYFLLKGSNNIFVATSDLSPELPLVEVGDSIQVKFDDSNQRVIQISDLKNFNIPTFK